MRVPAFILNNSPHVAVRMCREIEDPLIDARRQDNDGATRSRRRADLPAFAARPLRPHRSHAVGRPGGTGTLEPYACNKIVMKNRWNQPEEATGLC